MGAPISNVDIIPLFLLRKLEPSIATICFNRNVVSTLVLLLLQSGMNLQGADLRSAKGTWLRCRLLCHGWEMGTWQLVVSAGNTGASSEPGEQQLGGDLKCFLMELLLLSLALEPNVTIVCGVTEAKPVFSLTLLHPTCHLHSYTWKTWLKPQVSGCSWCLMSLHNEGFKMSRKPKIGPVEVH